MIMFCMVTMFKALVPLVVPWKRRNHRLIVNSTGSSAVREFQVAGCLSRRLRTRCIHAFLISVNSETNLRSKLENSNLIDCDNLQNKRM